MLGAFSVAPMLSRASLLTRWADANGHGPGASQECELLLVVRVTNVLAHTRHILVALARASIALESRRSK
jgi:hypothetical protein